MQDQSTPTTRDAERRDAVFIERFELGDGDFKVAVKDVADIAGHATRLGSAAFDHASPALENADIIERLLGGGASIVGKTNMHELAYGVTGLNARYGTPINPAFPDLIPGGSSSGSAVAVAGGLCDAAIGTDTGGSIRVPAACCGVLGLKPTFGRVSRRGLTPKASSLDCVGPFARDAVALDHIMSLIAPVWSGIATTATPRLTWLRSQTSPAIADAAKSWANQLDPEMRAVEVASLETAHQAGLTIIAHETYQSFGHLIGTGQVDPDVAARLKRAEAITADQIENAERVRTLFSRDLNRVLESCDALALPTLAEFPPLVADAGDLQAMVNITSLCRPFNLSGHPAISIPLPPINGKPVSLQLVAAKGKDEHLVALAKRAETLFKTDSNSREH